VKRKYSSKDSTTVKNATAAIEKMLTRNRGLVMSEELDSIVDNFKQVSAWIRVLFMFAFAIVLYLVIAPTILVLMIVQALFVIITGDSNSNLRFLGAALSKYIFQILQFLSYISNTKPFPFSDFPKVDNDEFNPPSAAKKKEGDTASNKKEERKTSSVKKKAPTRKASRKKAAPKKAAPKKAAAKKEQSESSVNSAADKGPE
jgi:hypothetical protein|tara:strand:+ start:256 stop:861 length:606 start_codon:yes stop_codon:yes gene_type:complete